MLYSSSVQVTVSCIAVNGYELLNKQNYDSYLPAKFTIDSFAFNPC